MRRAVRDVVGGKQGRGGKKPAAKKAPTGQLPSEPFKALLRALNKICVTVGDVLCADDEMSREACHERGQDFLQFVDQRITGQKKLQILEEMEESIAEFVMGLVFDKTAETKTNVYQLIEKLHDAIYSCINETLGNLAEDEAESSSEIQAEKELECLIKVFGSLLVTTAAQKPQYKPIFRKHYVELLEASMKIGQSSFRGNQLREQALNLSSGLVTVDPAAVVEFGLVGSMIESCFKLCADPSDEGLDPSGFSSQNLGTQHLDGLAFTVKPNTVVAEAVHKKALELLAGQDRYERKSALVCLAVLPESCSDYCRQADKLSSMIQPAIDCCSDSDELVKGAAFICLAEFVQHLQPQVQSYHKDILPRIISALESQEESTMVKTKACIPLTQVCSHVNATDVDSVVAVLPSLVKIIKQTRAKLFKLKDDIELIESLNHCIRSIAISCGGQDKLKDYATEVVDLMLEMMKDSDEMYNAVRSAATFCLGDLVKAMGKEQVKPYYETIISEINAAVQESNVELRGACHCVFADLVSTLTTDVLPQVSTYINSILRCLAIDYKGKSKGKGDDDDEDQDEEDEEEDEEDDDEEDDGEDDDFDGEDDDEAENPVTDERRWALHAIKTCISTYKTEFLPYHEKVFNVIFEHSRDYEDEVQGYIANMIACFPHMFPLEQQPQSGQSLTLDQPTKNLFQSVMIMLNHFVEKSSEGEVVAVSLDAMAALVKHFGQVILLDDNKSLDNIIANSKKLLEGKLFCQLSDEEQEELFMKGSGQFGDDEDEEDEEDDEDEDEDDEDEAPVRGKKSGGKKSDGCQDSLCHDPKCDDECGDDEEDEDDKDPVIQSGLELLQAVSKARGVEFAPVLAELYDLIIKTNEDELQEGFAVGVLAEMLEPLGDAFTPYIPKIFNAVFDMLKSWKDNIGVAHNSSFCLGVLTSKAGEAAVPFYGQAYQALKSLSEKVKVTDEKAANVDAILACRDNITSAVGKLLTVASSSADVPQDEAFSLFFSGLPLTHDMEEAAQAYSVLAKLVSLQPQRHDALLNAYKSVLTSASLNDSLKSSVVEGAASLLKANESLKQSLDSWSAADKETFLSAVKL